MKHVAVHIGNFLFRYRDKLFPIVVVAMFALAVPPRTVLGSSRLEAAKDVLAVLVALAGLSIRAAVIGYAYIQRGGRNRRVYAKDLVTEGIFGICRNPLYIGNLLICLAILLMHGSATVLVLGAGFYLVAYSCIVQAEEAFLHERFGEAYQRYCRDVPRWIPRLSGLRRAIEGMRFSPGRVVAKDYGTVALTIAVLASTEAYEYLADGGPTGHVGYLAFLGVVVALCGMAALAVRTLKRRGFFRRRASKTLGALPPDGSLSGG